MNLSNFYNRIKKHILKILLEENLKKVLKNIIKFEYICLLN